MTASHLLFVALGGAIGAVGRYAAVGAVEAFVGTAFPFGTLFVNVIGSFAMGAFIEVSALAWSPGHELRAMIVIGVLGAFTTFSAFSLDAVTLLTRGEQALALLYIGGSVLASILVLYAGMAVTRLIIL